MFREMFIESNLKDIQEGKGVDNLIRIMDGWLKQGWSLKDIYDEVLKFLGKEDGDLIFYKFVHTHKNNKKFMKEFNRTIFN